MARPVLANLDFGNSARIVNLPDGTLPQHAATVSQLNSAVEGLAWKDSARVATQSNLNLASPGATVDGVTMVVADRVLVRAQSAASENGLYIWNGSAVAMSRALDADAFPELEQAIVTVEEGTSAGATYRQTAVNGTLGSTSVTWTGFGIVAPAANETTSGIAEIATQAETDAGSDDLRIVTPLKLASYVNRAKRFAATIGDGSATSFAINHNLGTEDVQVTIYQATGSKYDVLCDVRRTSTNAIVCDGFTAAPAIGALRVVVTA
ncbi:MAG: hypothetical protein JHC87_01810 [Thermoleophilaceae bacterium]|nr:hypothetical protein [Thermoleophilaceae bacterium]